jgi:hypothetical protein
MGQLIACATAEGVLVGSDSRTVIFEPGGEERLISLNRLLKVADHVILASAGAVEAQDLCQDFAGFAKGEKLTDVDELIDAAIPYFTGRVDDVMRRMCEKLPLDPVINLYLLLAGYSAKTPDHPGRLFIIWDRPKPPKVEFNRVADVFTLPRRLGLEYRLSQLVKQQAPLAALVDAARAGLEKLAGQDESVGAPYRFYTVSNTGMAEA